jgi:hypothetical protein
MTVNWDSEKQARFIIFEQGIDRDSFSDRSKPNDIHLVDYVLNGREYCDAVRSYKMVDIFDGYHDKLKAENDGSRVLRITSGHGDTNPKLYNVKKKE